VMLGHEEADIGRMDNEQSRRIHALSGQRRQFPEMPCPPGGDGVGEHGQGLVEKRAGLDLKEDVPAFSPQQEIEPAVPDRMLRLYDRCAFKARDPVFFYETAGNGIIVMGMEHDGDPVSLRGNCHELEASLRGRGKFREIESGPGKKKFPKPPGVGKVGADFPPIDRAFDDKAVGAGDEGSGDDIPERLHRAIVTDPAGDVIKEREGY
jgi:hypothetical protein